ncbi:hypothetical protein DUE52_21875 [Larkinella punicea]|uniref:Uncharacterized protein n=2 Tax=Larkinella punicea TaxID=2315727 RepID=A0A368JLM0_9BACT|nr:hypothetical protein DUE52_21875 [Larkinella punicea]
MESNSTILVPANSIYPDGGLYLRFFQKELFLPLDELGSTQFVEERATDFLMDTIRDDWGFTSSYDSAIKEDSENPKEASKTVRIQIPLPSGKITEDMAKLETLIGYTHDEIIGMKSRSDDYSTTPFDPNAIRIAYFGPGMSEPLTNFGFEHDYSGQSLFGEGRSTYSIRLQFPNGYFDPQENKGGDEPVKTGDWHLKSLGQKIHHLRTQEKAPLVSFPKSTIPTIYAIGTYREQPLGKKQTGRLPVVGGEFPHVFVELPSGKQYPLKHEDVVRYETPNGEEIDVLWAEIHLNDEVITPRFLHLSYEIIDYLIKYAPAAKGNPGSLKAVIFESDSRTIRCFMSLNLWTP